MVVAALPNFRRDLKTSDQNNSGGPEQGNKFEGVPMNPNDVMVIVLKDILLCLLGFKFRCIVYIS